MTFEEGGLKLIRADQMPINNRREPSLKDFGWLVLVMVGVLAVWFSMAGRQDRRYEDRIDIVREQQAAEATEQSLDALETQLSSEMGAAGEPIKVEEATGAYARKSETSSLPAPQDKEEEKKESDSSLAAELDAIAKGKKGSGSSSTSGWEAAVKTAKAAGGGYPAPFTPPRANFGALGASDAGGGGSSGASFSTNDGFFNTSKANPARITSAAPELGGAAAGGANKSATLDSLKKTEALATQSMGTANNDAAAGYNAQAFDLASARNGTLNLGGAGAPLVNEGGAVKDLKDMLASKAKIDKKDPNIDKVKDKAKKDAEKAAEKKNNPFSAENMSTMIMTMAISTAIGGVMGPIAGGIGAAMTSAMGMQQPYYQQPTYAPIPQTVTR